MNLLNQSIKNHGYSNWYNYQFFPLAGACASIPAALTSGAGAITNLFYAAVSLSSNKEEASKCFWAARDLSVIFANNLLNICTLGILNYALLNNGLLTLKDAKKSEQEPKQSSPNPAPSNDQNEQRKAPPLPTTPPQPTPGQFVPPMQQPFAGPNQPAAYNPPSGMQRAVHQPAPQPSAYSPVPQSGPSTMQGAVYPNAPQPAGYNPAPQSGPSGIQGAVYQPAPQPAGYTPVPQSGPSTMQGAVYPNAPQPAGYNPAPQSGPSGIQGAVHQPSAPIHQGSQHPQASIAECLSWQDLDGKKVEGHLVLSPGNQTIKLQHGGLAGYPKDSMLDFATTGPIYTFNNARFGNMQASDTCLVMTEADFHLISRIIHSGAFGGCVSKIKENLVVVWKIPADLLYIGNYQAKGSSKGVPVGRYPMQDDFGNFADRTSAQIVGQPSEKFRIDKKIGPHELDSIHYLVVDKGDQKYHLPGISTGNFFKDFNAPQGTEWAYVNQMLEDLRQLGINAFPCNGNQHMIVLYSHSRNQGGAPELLTPESFAWFLQNDQRIFPAIQKGANKNLTNWARIYCDTFGQKK